MKSHNVISISVGSLYAALYVRPSTARASGLKLFGLYIQWRQRVRVQWPRRQNFAVPYDRDLPRAELMRTWGGLTEGDPGCEPTYKPTRTWADIAVDPTTPLGGVWFAKDQIQAMARALECSQRIHRSPA